MLASTVLKLTSDSQAGSWPKVQTGAKYRHPCIRSVHFLEKHFLQFSRDKWKKKPDHLYQSIIVSEASCYHWHQFNCFPLLYMVPSEQLCASPKPFQVCNTYWYFSSLPQQSELTTLNIPSMNVFFILYSVRWLNKHISWSEDYLFKLHKYIYIYLFFCNKTYSSLFWSVLKLKGLKDPVSKAQATSAVQ